MDADAELDAALGRQAGVALDEAMLHLDRATHRVDDAAKLDDDAVARALDHPAAMDGDRRLDQVAPQRAHTRQNPVLVGARQPREPDDVGHQNCRQFARLSHWLDSPPVRAAYIGLAAATIQDLRVGRAGR